MLSITSAQINPTIGDISGNINLMLSAALLAKENQSNIVVFPEMSLTAYYPGDLLDDQHFQTAIDVGLIALKNATNKTPDLYWVVGAPMRRNGVGKAYHNALLVIKNGEIVLQYFKQLLPTYGIFDERRHFEPGQDVARILKIKGISVGFLICEDGWNDESKDYMVNPFQRLADASPDLIVSINASPSNLGKREQRHKVFTNACKRHKIPLLYVNQVGGHDQLVYDGASFAVSADGNISYEAKRFTTDITTMLFDDLVGEFTNLQYMDFPVDLTGLPKMEFYRQQIILGLTDYCRRCGFTKAVVGCSGGIDSALTLALAVEALGADNVTAITMPSVFSSLGSVSDSEVLCKNLGIELKEHTIRHLVAEYEATFEQTFAKKLTGLALENVQARIRGTILMEYSNTFGHLLLTTGNKSEVSVGYFTLYGDSNGGLGLIGDLYKTEVFELCRHINETAGKELIPTAIIDKAPSAELAPDQKDENSLPPYSILDEILKHLIEGSQLSIEEKLVSDAKMKSLQSTKDGQLLIGKVKKMISNSEFKRRQAPPILRLRGRAFGSGRQLPIAAIHYQI